MVLRRKSIMDLKDSIPKETLERIEAREAEILGKPARLPNVDKQAIAEEVIEVTTALRADLFPGAPALSFEEVPEIMFTMQPYLTIWSKIMAMSMQLLGPNAMLPRPDQKLAILRTGWLLEAPFEFGEHAKEAGLHQRRDRPGRRTRFCLSALDHSRGGSSQDGGGAANRCNGQRRHLGRVGHRPRTEVRAGRANRTVHDCGLLPERSSRKAGERQQGPGSKIGGDRPSRRGRRAEPNF